MGGGNGSPPVVTERSDSGEVSEPTMLKMTLGVNATSTLNKEGF